MGPQWHQVIAASRRSHWVSLANSSDPNHTWWDTSGLLVEGFPGKVDGWRMIGDDSQSKQNILESLNMFSIVQHICRLRWMPRIQHLKHNWRVAMFHRKHQCKVRDMVKSAAARQWFMHWCNNRTIKMNPDFDHRTRTIELQIQVPEQSLVFFPTNWSHRIQFPPAIQKSH